MPVLPKHSVSFWRQGVARRGDVDGVVLDIPREHLSAVADLLRAKKQGMTDAAPREAMISVVWGEPPI